MSTRATAGGWNEVRRLLLAYRRPILWSLALTALSRVAALSVPVTSKHVVDELVAGHPSDRLALLALLATVAVAAEVLAAYLASEVALATGQRASAEVREELQARVIALPLSHLESIRSGALPARIVTDAEQVRFFVGLGLVHLVASLLTATLAVGLLFGINQALTAVVLVLVSAFAVCVGRRLNRLSGAYTRVLQQQAELTDILSQTLGAVRAVKARVAEEYEATRFTLRSRELSRTTVALLRNTSLLNCGSAAVAGSIGILLLVLGGQAVGAGEMSLGSFVMYLWLSGLLLGPVLHLAGSVGEVAKAIAAAGRIAQLRNLPTEAEEDRHRAAVILDYSGAVVLDRVSYGYGSGRHALRDISLIAPAGSTTALVGPNGSGKSTVCRLLIAYDRPTAGRILIDGRDLAALNRRAYRARLGVVLQDDWLFDGTIADNIRYGRPAASQHEVLAAGRAAHCDEFTSDLPLGYSTPIGVRGLRLSAGQRQRVAIARALLLDPRILILDEATANVDAESERLIVEALNRLRRSRTTFVIAHRHETIQDADRIVVLDRGRMVEVRTYHELLRHGVGLRLGAPNGSGAGGRGDECRL